MSDGIDTVDEVLDLALDATPDEVAGGHIHISGSNVPTAIVRQLAALRYCCEGAAVYGPDRCTCWTPEYDLEQTDPDTTSEPGIQPAMCADCAYRPNSPERSGDERYAHSTAEGDGGPLALAEGNQPFWCHQGMRKPVRWRHDTLGITVEADSDAYEPPMVGGVPYLADGRAGAWCAGWFAHRFGART
jgi:hypothetical protein